MNVQIHEANKFYQKASRAEQQGAMDLAEVYYLKCASAFEKAGGSYAARSAQALNALASLRSVRGDYAGAIYSAKRSVQVLEAHASDCDAMEAELILMQAWDLIQNMVNDQILSLGLTPRAI